MVRRSVLYVGFMCRMEAHADLQTREGIMKKKANKNKGGRPPGYPFANMVIGQVVVLVYETQHELTKSRGASYAIGYSHRWKFESEKRKTDAGKFELTVKRIS